jgi:hypothetical protein
MSWKLLDWNNSVSLVEYTCFEFVLSVTEVSFEEASKLFQGSFRKSVTYIYCILDVLNVAAQYNSSNTHLHCIQNNVLLLSKLGT